MNRTTTTLATLLLAPLTLTADASAIPTFAATTVASSEQDDWARLSPFEMVRWDGELPEVKVEGSWYKFEAIDGIERDDLLDFAREAFGDRWAKRFCEDLVEVLGRMDHIPGEMVELQLMDLESGESITLDAVEMSGENRRRIRDARPRPGKSSSGSAQPVSRVKRERPASVAAEFKALVSTCPEMDGSFPVITRAQAIEDLEQLEWLIAHKFSYRERVGFDWPGAFDALHASLGASVSQAAFALKVHKLLTRFGDGHSRLRLSTPSLFLPGALPVRLVRDDFGVAAIDATGALLDAEHPYLVAIDGVPLATWLTATSELIPGGSQAMEGRGALRRVVHVPHLRSQLGREASMSAKLTLADRAGTKRTREVALVENPVRATRGAELEARRLEGDVGYLRIGSMGGDESFLARLDGMLDDLAGVSGLVIDVRGNGGGSRLPLLHVAPRLMPEDLDAVVGNVAALRVDSESERKLASEALTNRYLHPGDWKGWSDAASQAVEHCAANFEAGWQTPEGEFSDWHYLLIERATERQRITEGRVIVLLDAGCFSATDIFLGALAELPNVTLLGESSGGGSGRARKHVLANSGLPVQLSTMVSFLPDGATYDGKGIAPDVIMAATLEDHLGETDSVLEQAAALALDS